MGNIPHHEAIGKIALFGSYLYGTANDESDVDLLVEFVPNQVLSEAETLYEQQTI